MIYKDYYTPSPVIEENRLEHYGVLGMKWGVRKEKAQGNSKKLAKMDKKWEKEMTPLSKTWMAVYNAAADAQNEWIPSFNARYNSDKLDMNANPLNAYTQRYVKEYTDHFISEMDKALGDDKINPSGTKAVSFTYDIMRESLPRTTISAVDEFIKKN